MILNKIYNKSTLHELKSLSSNDREMNFIKKISRMCAKGDVVVYYLYTGKLVYGFIALNVNKIDDIPTIEVEYILVKKDYRKKVFEDLDNKKISEYFLYFAYDLGLKLKEEIGLRWLSLVPDNVSLENYYKNKYNFTKFAKTKFLFLSLK